MARRGSIGRRLGALVLLGATLAACLDAPVATPIPTPTRQPDPTPVTTTYDLRASVWYEGLVLQVDSAVAVLDARGGPVEVHLRIDNAQEEPGELDGQIRLVVAGTPIEATRESVVPTVPAKGSVGVVLTYELQGIASIDEAVLEVGDEPLHVARVPMTPAAGETLAFEPITFALEGAATAGSTRVTLRSGLLRWDLPDWSQELAAGLQALTVTYDVTYAGDFGGGLAFTGDSIGLRLPDGKEITYRADGRSQSIELIGPRKTKRNLFSRFEIPAGVPGKYAFLVRSGSTEKAITFTIGG